MEDMGKTAEGPHVSISRAILAFLLTAAGIAGTYFLLHTHEIGEASFVTLVCVSLISGFGLALGDRLQSFSLKDLSVELSKVEAVRAEVEQREKEIRRIAVSTAEIVMFVASLYGRLGGEESKKTMDRWLENRARRLLKESYSSHEDDVRVFKYSRACEALDRLYKVDPKSIEAEWNKIMAMVEQDK